MPNLIANDPLGRPFPPTGVPLERQRGTARPRENYWGTETPATVRPLTGALNGLSWMLRFAVSRSIRARTRRSRTSGPWSALPVTTCPPAAMSASGPPHDSNPMLTVAVVFDEMPLVGGLLHGPSPAKEPS